MTGNYGPYYVPYVYTETENYRLIYIYLFYGKHDIRITHIKGRVSK